MEDQLRRSGSKHRRGLQQARRSHHPRDCLGRGQLERRPAQPHSLLRHRALRNKGLGPEGSHLPGSARPQQRRHRLRFGHVGEQGALLRPHLRALLPRGGEEGNKRGGHRGGRRQRGLRGGTAAKAAAVPQRTRILRDFRVQGEEDSEGGHRRRLPLHLPPQNERQRKRPAPAHAPVIGSSGRRRQPILLAGSKCRQPLQEPAPDCGQCNHHKRRGQDQSSPFERGSQGDGCGEEQLRGEDNWRRRHAHWCHLRPPASGLLPGGGSQTRHSRQQDDRLIRRQGFSRERAPLPRDPEGGVGEAPGQSGAVMSMIVVVLGSGLIIDRIWKECRSCR